MNSITTPQQRKQLLDKYIDIEFEELFLKNMEIILNSELFMNSKRPPMYYSHTFDDMLKDYWSDITVNKNITLHSLIKYPNKLWNWKILVFNPNFDINWIKHFPDKKSNFEWELIQQYCPNFNISWINEYPSFDSMLISRNPNFTIDWIFNIPNYKDLKWDWYYIPFNKNFDISWVDKLPNEFWNWVNISNSNNFKIEWYEKYKEKPWLTESFINSDHFNISWVIKHPTLNWDDDWLTLAKDTSDNPSYNHDYELDYNKESEYELEYDDELECKHILQYETIPIFEHILKEIESHPWESPYKLNFIKELSDLNYKSLCMVTECALRNITTCSYTQDKIKLKEKIYRENIAAYRIQQFWFESKYRTDTKFGIKCFNKRYEELVNGKQ